MIPRGHLRVIFSENWGYTHIKIIRTIVGIHENRISIIPCGFHFSVNSQGHVGIAHVG